MFRLILSLALLGTSANGSLPELRCECRLLEHGSMLDAVIIETEQRIAESNAADLVLQRVLDNTESVQQIARVIEPIPKMRLPKQAKGVDRKSHSVNHTLTSYDAEAARGRETQIYESFGNCRRW